MTKPEPKQDTERTVAASSDALTRKVKNSGDTMSDAELDKIAGGPGGSPWIGRDGKASQ